jgi:ceramide glucosyltransferase
VILQGILAALAILSFLLTLWQWLAARRFPLHRRSAEHRLGALGSDRDSPSQSSALPPITLLKPLHGADEHTEACLRSWFTQDYAGQTQILFAVADADDPASAVVKRLLAEFPQRDARLVVCPGRLGANAKVSKLAQLQPHAKHALIVISDADVFAPPDLLANLISPLAISLGAPASLPARSSDGSAPAEMPALPGRIGLVNCFYRLARPGTLARRYDAVAINADFWSQVLQSRALKRLDFALGAVMAVRREALDQIGGFTAFADHLADDYQLGRRIARAGWRIEFCPVVVECRDAANSWRRIWARQLRWARTIRVCEPLPYFFSLLSNGTLWPLLWLALTASPQSLAVGGGFLLARIAVAADLQRRLTQSSANVRDFWLVPAKDLLQVALWILAFTGRSIEWHGEQFRLRQDGTLVR